MKRALSHSLSRIAVATLAAAGLAMAGAGSASACGFDCVSGPVTVRPSNDGARISFSTTVPVKATVSADTSPNYGFQPSRASDSVHGTQHSLLVGPLLPGRSYNFSLLLVDQSGRSFTRTPQAYPTQAFRSMHRRVAVYFYRMHVSDDSDAWSAGELYVSFRVHNTIRAHHWSNAAWTSGTANNPNLELAAVDTSEVALVDVEALDDDTDPWEFCRTGLAPSWTNGSTSCAEWSTAHSSIYLRGHAPGWFSLPAFSSPALPRFSISASYHVSYYS